MLDVGPAPGGAWSPESGALPTPDPTAASSSWVSSVSSGAPAGVVAVDPVALAGRLLALLVTEGGFTLDVRTAGLVERGLAVCADPTRSLRVGLHDWDDGGVRAWLRDACGFVTRIGDADLHLGGWYPGGAEPVVLDVVRVVAPDRRDDAHRLARLHRQRALFDLGRRAVVPVVPVAAGGGH